MNSNSNSQLRYKKVGGSNNPKKNHKYDPSCITFWCGALIAFLLSILILIFIIIAIQINGAKHSAHDLMHFINGVKNKTENFVKTFESIPIEEIIKIINGAYHFVNNNNNEKNLASSPYHKFINVYEKVSLILKDIDKINTKKLIENTKNSIILFNKLLPVYGLEIEGILKNAKNITKYGSNNMDLINNLLFHLSLEVEEIFGDTKNITKYGYNNMDFINNLLVHYSLEIEQILGDAKNMTESIKSIVKHLVTTHNFNIQL